MFYKVFCIDFRHYLIHSYIFVAIINRTFLIHYTFQLVIVYMNSINFSLFILCLDPLLNSFIEFVISSVEFSEYIAFPSTNSFVSFTILLPLFSFVSKCALASEPC